MSSTQLNLKYWLIAAIASLVSLILGVGYIAFSGMTRGESGLRSVYDNEVKQFLYLKSVHDVYASEIMNHCHAALTGEASFASARERIQASIRKADKEWRNYMDGFLEPKEAKMAEEIMGLKGPVDAAMARLEEILDAEDQEKLRNFHSQELAKATMPYCEKVNELFDSQKVDAAIAVAETESSFYTMKTILAASLAAGLSLAGFLTVSLFRMQRTLNQNEARYRSLVTATAQMVWTTNPEGKVVEDIPGWCAFTGQSWRAAKDLGWSNALHPEDRERVQTELRQGLETLTAYNGRYRVRQYDGQYRLFAVRGVPVLDTRGRLAEWVSACTDITEQEEAERRRQLTNTLLQLFAQKGSSREYLNSVLEAVQDWTGCQNLGIRVSTEKGSMPYEVWGGFEERFLHLQEAESVLTPKCACVRTVLGPRDAPASAGRTPGGSFSCGDVERFVESLSPESRAGHCGHCLKQGFASVALVPLRCKNEILGILHFADRRPNYFSAEVLRFLEALSPLIGEALQRFKIEESLRESEQLFRAMFESHQSVMLLIAPDTGAIVDANPAAAIFYGASRADLCCRTVTDLRLEFPPPGNNGPRRSYPDRTERFETATRVAEGEIRTVEVHSSTVTTQGQLRLFAILHDITQRKELEKTLLKTNEEQRQQIGRDLHESLGQKLTGAALASRVLSQTLAGQANAAESTLADEISKYLKEAIIETRSLAKEVCPVGLSPAGLVGDLREMAGKIEGLPGVKCHCRTDESVIIDDERAAQLFRIAQEAINRAIHRRHSSNIRIDLAGRVGHVILEIETDGELPDEADRNNDLRLRTIQHRADAINARLEIEEVSSGTELIRCTIEDQNPIVQPEAGPAEPCVDPHDSTPGVGLSE